MSMRFFILFMLIFLSSCTVKFQNCDANPTVQQNKSTPEDTKKDKDILDKIGEQVTPGAKLKCTF